MLLMRSDAPVIGGSQNCTWYRILGSFGAGAGFPAWTGVFPSRLTARSVARANSVRILTPQVLVDPRVVMASSRVKGCHPADAPASARACIARELRNGGEIDRRRSSCEIERNLSHDFR